VSARRGLGNTVDQLGAVGLQEGCAVEGRDLAATKFDEGGADDGGDPLLIGLGLLGCTLDTFFSQSAIRAGMRSGAMSRAARSTTLRYGAGTPSRIGVS
jgi:hypothetical protein